MPSCGSARSKRWLLRTRGATLRAAGFEVQIRRVVSETVSGSLAARERVGFSKLVDRMEGGDVLVVTKMDRLGRNAMDVRATVELLASMGVKVHCLTLGGVDLTSSTGRMTMSVINAVAEFERDLLVERTNVSYQTFRPASFIFATRPSTKSALSYHA